MFDNPLIKKITRYTDIIHIINLLWLIYVTSKTNNMRVLNIYGISTAIVKIYDIELFCPHKRFNLAFYAFFTILRSFLGTVSNITMVYIFICIHALTSNEFISTYPDIITRISLQYGSTLILMQSLIILALIFELCAFIINACNVRYGLLMQTQRDKFIRNIKKCRRK